MAPRKLMENCALLLCLLFITFPVFAEKQSQKKDLNAKNLPSDGVSKTTAAELHIGFSNESSKPTFEAHEQISATTKNEKQNLNPAKPPAQIEPGEEVATTTKNEKQDSNAAKPQKLPARLEPGQTIAPIARYEHVVDETKVNTKDINFDYEDDDLQVSYIPGFYIFLALSLSAMLFIVFRIYRLRLSRAERKYGVQGDRSTQELVPLPVSIEDGNSEDEDHTLFEVGRQQARRL